MTDPLAALRRHAPEAALADAIERLTALGGEWAGRRGSDWTTVLNAGPLPTPAARYAFRWQVVAEALRHTAGLRGTPPADAAALPLGLQRFLSWALPAAVLGQGTVADFNAERSARARAEADALAEDLGDAPPPPPPAGPPSGGATIDLLAAALSADGDDLPAPGPRRLIERLRAGPLPLDELRQLAAAFDLLPGTLLDATDRWAIRHAGVPATVVADGTVGLSPDYRRLAGPVA